MAWIYVSTKVDTHQKQAKSRQYHSNRSRRSVEGGVGPVAGA